MYEPVHSVLAERFYTPSPATSYMSSSHVPPPDPWPGDCFIAVFAGQDALCTMEDDEWQCVGSGSSSCPTVIGLPPVHSLSTYYSIAKQPINRLTVCSNVPSPPVTPVGSHCGGLYCEDSADDEYLVHRGHDPGSDRNFVAGYGCGDVLSYVGVYGHVSYDDGYDNGHDPGPDSGPDRGYVSSLDASYDGNLQHTYDECYVHGYEDGVSDSGHDLDHESLYRDSGYDFGFDS